MVDHPLTSDNAKSLRQRVVTFLMKFGSLIRNSHILFVCGGSKEDCLRYQFGKYAEEFLPELRVFYPELAVDHLVPDGGPSFENLNEFEKLIGELAAAIVIFPESPGSCAELGLFSANKLLSKKILMVLDANQQGKDSFLTSGPVREIDQVSKFGEAIQLDYEHPKFEWITKRLDQRIKGRQYGKSVSQLDFSDISTEETLFLIHWFASISRLFTSESLEFLFKSVFGHSEPKNIRRIVAILLATGEFNYFADDGMMSISADSKPFLEAKSGAADNLSELRMEIAEYYANQHPNFQSMIQEAYR